MQKISDNANQWIQKMDEAKLLSLTTEFTKDHRSEFLEWVTKQPALIQMMGEFVKQHPDLWADFVNEEYSEYRAEYEN